MLIAHFLQRVGEKRGRAYHDGGLTVTDTDFADTSTI